MARVNISLYWTGVDKTDAEMEEERLALPETRKFVVVGRQRNFSAHRTFDMQHIPRVGDTLVFSNQAWIVESVTCAPDENQWTLVGYLKVEGQLIVSDHPELDRKHWRVMCSHYVRPGVYV